MRREVWLLGPRRPALPYTQLHDAPCFRAIQPQTLGDYAATAAIESTVRAPWVLDSSVALDSELLRSEWRPVIVNARRARTGLTPTARTQGGTAHPASCVQRRAGVEI